MAGDEDGCGTDDRRTRRTGRLVISDPARHLRVVNPETGELTEGAGAELVALRAKLEDTEAALAKECRTSQALRNQLSAQKRRAANAEQVRDVLDYWHRKCRGSSARVKVPVDGKRGDAVRKMLATFSVDELKEAVDGAAAFPFQHYDRRFCEAGPNRERRDDLDFICADERRVEKLRDLIGMDHAHRRYRAFVWECVRRDPSVLPALVLLASLDPHGEVLAAAARWAKEQAA